MEMVTPLAFGPELDAPMATEFHAARSVLHSAKSDEVVWLATARLNVRLSDDPSLEA